MQILRYLLLLLFLIGGGFAINAQLKPDEVLILKADFTDNLLIHERKVTFGVGRSSNVILRYNPVSLVFSGLMYSYQKWFSPQVSAECLYSPSCSEYSKLLFREYGFFKGIFTSADRLMRCDRISATTISPLAVNEKDGKVHESVSRYRIKSK